MLNIILIDDEPKALKSLQWEIDNFCSEVKVDATFTNPKEALRYLDHQRPDAIFLDIEMPEMDGFEFLDHMHQRSFSVIFVTAYDQYAINAIKKDALDYLLKPIDTDDLIATVEKLRQKKASSKEALEKSSFAAQPQRSNRIAVPTDGKLLFLTPDEIIYCKSDGNYCKIYLTEKKPILVSKKLKDIQELLPQSKFYRVHNSYIVNLGKVREYLKTDSYVVLEQRIKIPVSRYKKSAFLDKI